MKFSHGMTFAASPPLRPGLESSATQSMPAQDPTSRETSSSGVHVFTYHPPARRLGEQVSTGGPPGGEHGQRLAVCSQGHAQNLQPIVAVLGNHVVQGRETPLEGPGREPSALPSTKLGCHVALLPSCCLCAGGPGVFAHLSFSVEILSASLR